MFSKSHFLNQLHLCLNSQAAVSQFHFIIPVSIHLLRPSSLLMTFKRVLSFSKWVLWFARVLRELCNWLTKQTVHVHHALTMQSEHSTSLSICVMYMLMWSSRVRVIWFISSVLTLDSLRRRRNLISVILRLRRRLTLAGVKIMWNMALTHFTTLSCQLKL